MTTEPKHTPGPWEAEPVQSRDADNCRDFVIAQPGQDGNVVCKVTNPWNDDAQVANARLIAAAPELLEALKYARDIVKMELGENSAHLVPLDAALAKAGAK